MSRTKKTARRLAAVLMTVCVGAMLCVPVYAYWASFKFWPPFESSLRYTEAQPSTASPYVKHTGHSVDTTYVLQARMGGAISDDPKVSDIIVNYTDTSRKAFTYQAGYGGAGEKYYLVAYPSYLKFAQYTAEFDWSP